MVTVYGETINGLDTDYASQASLTVKDQNGVTVASGSDYQLWDNASVALQFTATPGSVYTAATYHCLRLQSWSYDYEFPYHQFYYDDWYMSSFLGQNIYEPWDYWFASPGWQEVHRTTNVICIGKTYDSVTVPPHITSISPAQAGVGSTTRVTVNGTGFHSTDIFGSVAGVTVSIVSISSTQIVADFAMASNAEGGNRLVTVVASGGQRSNAVYFFGQIPTSMSVLSVLAISSQEGQCTSNDFGLRAAVQYQVNDQRSPAVPISNNIMVPQETVTNFVLNGVTQPDPIPTYDDIGPSNVSFTSRTTDANGRFYDAPWGACQGSAFTATFSQNIRILIDGTQTSYHVRTNNGTYSSNALGTGTVTNGSDIQKSNP